MKQPTSVHDVTRLCFIVNLIAGVTAITLSGLFGVATVGGSHGD